MPKLHKFTNSARHITAGRQVKRSFGRAVACLPGGFAFTYPRHHRSRLCTDLFDEVLNATGIADVEAHSQE